MTGRDDPGRARHAALARLPSQVNSPGRRRANHALALTGAVVGVYRRSPCRQPSIHVRRSSLESVYASTLLGTCQRIWWYIYDMVVYICSLCTLFVSHLRGFALLSLFFKHVVESMNPAVDLAPRNETVLQNLL